MATRFDDIARRKLALVNKAAQERAELARNYANLKSPFDISGTMLGIGRALKSHPIVAAGLSSFFVSGYGGKAMLSASKMLQFWKLTLPILTWLRKLRKK